MAAFGIWSKRYFKMKLLAQYQNGNYQVSLYEDGSKTKMTEEDAFVAGFPDSMDVKITNCCDLGCPMCHENATTDGKHADLNASFLAHLHPGTELAVGGGNPLSHPQLFPFLKRMKEQGVICNLTVNEAHLHSYHEQIERMLEEQLIYGLGISLSAFQKETISFAEAYPHAVLHLIAGMTSPTDWKILYDKGLKVLILGYKRFGRGVQHYSEKIERNICILKRNLPAISKRFQVISFDNLAIEQLELKKQLRPEVFDQMFMGEDGEATLYVDLVKGEFARSSTANERYPLLSTVDEMLQFLHQQGANAF